MADHAGYNTHKMLKAIPINTFTGIAVTALLYVLCAKLGLMFALPPGYATFFWPASGLAFAVVYLWGHRYGIGVFIGAFFANTINFFWESPDIILDPQVALNGLSIAAGATLQCCVAYMAVRRYVGEKTRLFKFREIVLFCLLAGPLACLISASWGTTTLLTSGVITVDNAAFSWLTWYVGDILGVLIISPVLVLLFAKSGVTPMRKFSVAVPMLLVFCLVMGSFIAMRDIDKDEKIRTFQSQTQRISQEIEEKMVGTFAKMNAMRAHFLSSNFVDRNEFNNFADNITKEHAETKSYKFGQTYNHSLAYAQRITDKADIDTSLRLKSLQGDSLEQSNHDCIPFCAIITYRYPDIEKAGALAGYDLMSQTDRKEAMMQALKTGEITFTSPINLVPVDTTNNKGFLAFLPIQNNGTTSGFILSATSYTDLIQDTMDDWSHTGINLKLYDITNGNNDLLFASSADKIKTSQNFVTRHQSIHGARLWAYDFYINDSDLISGTNWAIWYALGASLVFTFMTSVFLLSITGQTASIQNIVRTRTKELAASEKRFRAALEYAPIGMALLDMNREFIEFNAVMASIAGYTVEEFKNIKLKDITHPDDLDIDSPQLRDLLSGQISSYTVNRRYIRKDGEIITVLLSLSLIRDEEQNPEYFIAQAIDITEREKMEKELIRSNKELQDFAYIISHDLKAPLRHITLSAGFLEEEYAEQLDDKAAEFMKIMISGSERMQAMINGLLDYSRVRDKAQEEYQPINLNNAIDEAIANLTETIKESGANIFVDDMPEELKANPALMTQLFQNLIQNAIKYRKDDLDPQIIIQAHITGREWNISITDNGIGINKEYAEKIFKVFQRLHGEGKYEGTGIGLSICQRIVQFHKGEIWLDTDYTDGSRFIIRLPNE